MTATPQMPQVAQAPSIGSREGKREILDLGTFKMVDGPSFISSPEYAIDFQNLTNLYLEIFRDKPFYETSLTLEESTLRLRQQLHMPGSKVVYSFDIIKGQKVITSFATAIVNDADIIMEEVSRSIVGYFDEEGLKVPPPYDTNKLKRFGLPNLSKKENLISNVSLSLKLGTGEAFPLFESTGNKSVVYIAEFGVKKPCRSLTNLVRLTHELVAPLSEYRDTPIIMWTKDSGAMNGLAESLGMHKVFKFFGKRQDEDMRIVAYTTKLKTIINATKSDNHAILSFLTISLKKLFLEQDPSLFKHFLAKMINKKEQ